MVTVFPLTEATKVLGTCVKSQRASPRDDCAGKNKTAGRCQTRTGCQTDLNRYGFDWPLLTVQRL